MSPRRIELVEVSPRDGLQNEPEILSTEVKLELIRRAVAAGVRRLEAASFVNPKRVPQMADAEAVMAAREHLVQSRQVHLDQLAANLQEERVRRVLQDMARL
jgi:isopropylmalate/homocitrate/citramalate synthase